MSHKRVSKSKKPYKKKTASRQNISTKIKPSIRDLTKKMFLLKDKGKSDNANVLLKQIQNRRIPKKDIPWMVALTIDYINRARNGIESGTYNEIELGVYRAELLLSILRDNARKHGNYDATSRDGYEFEQFGEARGYLGETYSMMDEPEEWYDIDHRLDDAIDSIPETFIDNEYDRGEITL